MRGYSWVMDMYELRPFSNMNWLEKICGVWCECDMYGLRKNGNYVHSAM
jgi:hypothetical protein